MHIHPSNNLLLASLGAGREDVEHIQARSVAEARRKLLAAARISGLSEDEHSGTRRVEAHSYEVEQQRQGEEDGFGRLFSAKV